jgi:23S rRNA pseudouridine955/2504/2580 synthase
MHQIRAQLAHAGYPILGDGKYGNTTVNRKFKSKVQQLFAFRLCFDFPTKSKLSYLSGTSVEISAINETDLNQFNVLQI